MLTIKTAAQNKSQAQSSKAVPNSPEAVAEFMWSKITTTCAATSRSAPVQVFLDDDGQAQISIRADCTNSGMFGQYTCQKNCRRQIG